jgi:hypothetical protein
MAQAAAATIAFVGNNASTIAAVAATAAAAGSYAAASSVRAPGAGDGPRLENLEVMTSKEGAPLPRAYGSVRIGGQVIWATRLEEVAEEVAAEGGGGGKGGGASSGSSSTRYSYFANFAVALCEGEIGSIGRIWADTVELDQTEVTMRVYRGTEEQDVDPLIAAKSGGQAPAYRGTAYVVFERLPLAEFGNRIPQLSFEVIKPVIGETERLVRGVDIIPGSTEFGYDPQVVEQTELSSAGEVIRLRTENSHNLTGESDFVKAIDQLEATCPNVRTIALVVAWFGTDLRCGECEVKPGVEVRGKATRPHGWRVAGQTRETAYLVTEAALEGRRFPAYGGAPNDASVVRCLEFLKARGFKVMLYPFILMDVPANNVLPDPYGGGSQGAYPWRGRITLSVAPGLPGSPDKTPAAAAEIAAFTGGAVWSDFGTDADGVTYAGPADDWSFSRFILHLAKLGQLAGGVDYFLVGSEMVQMTAARDALGSYPFADELVRLIGEARNLLPSAEISYAADWSEYHSHRTDDGVWFHLDAVWDAADFVAIDNYLPLSDWRDGSAHLDFQAGYSSIYSLDYLKSQIEGGEFFDYFYADREARSAQNRTPIIDSAHGEHWVYGNKNLRGWWQNPHHNRPGGVRSGTSTSWTPEGKRIVFSEFGVAAVDKATNAPNLFPDPKSSEAALPPYSSGGRDDMVQRRAIRAFLEYWSDEANNPASSVYGGRMIDTEALCLWSWDARPFPTFPQDEHLWADAGNWRLGHWISARLGTVWAGAVAAELCEAAGVVHYDMSDALGSVDGFVIDRIMSARKALEPLEGALFLDFFESGGEIRAASKRSVPAPVGLDDDRLAPGGDGGAVQLERAQETEMPARVLFRYQGIDTAYRASATGASRFSVSTKSVDERSYSIVLDSGRAQVAAEALLFDQWAGIEGLSAGTLWSSLDLEPGDAVRYRGREYRLEEVVRADRRVEISGRSFDRSVFSAGVTASRQAETGDRAVKVAPLAVFADLPLLAAGLDDWRGYVAATATPWPGGVAVFRSPTDGGYALNAALASPASIGELTRDLAPGVMNYIDRGSALEVELYSGELQSVSREAFLAGSQALAVQHASGEWEIVLAEIAELVAERTYRLTGLMRGQLGTELFRGASTGARVIVLGPALRQVSMTPGEIGRSFYYRTGPAGISIGDDRYSTRQVTFRGVGRRPYSVAHLRARRSGGDHIVSWVRRTRIEGDSWEGVDVPLGEELELYVLEVRVAGELKRTAEAAAPDFLYSAAMKAADGYTGTEDLEVTVYQVSQSYGRGAPRSINVT